MLHKPPNMKVFVVTTAFCAFFVLLNSSQVNGAPRRKSKASEPVHTDGHDYKVVCYYGSWAVYRPDDGKFPVEFIDPHLCTHLIYGFAGLGHDNKIRSLDSWNDLADNWGKGAFKRFTTGLKSKNPKLKTIIAIGGWNEGSIKYSNMAENPASRKIFVDSVVEFCKQYDFDGLDMDWEYPAARGGKPEDKKNFAALLRELKAAFTPHNLLLTAAVSAGKHTMDPGYDIPDISQSLDIINVMAYDYRGGWETKCGHHAPLYARPEEPLDERTLNVNFSINYWISQGASPKKIILGMGLYGRSFTLQRAEVNKPFSPAPQNGAAGPFTREPGSLGYNEICDSIQREKWEVVRDEFFMAPYAFKDRQWVGYDDKESIEIKVNFAKSLGLGGGMVWSIETDDFLGKCHGEKFPLLSTINRVFAQKEAKPLPTIPPTPALPITTEGPTQSTPKVWWQPSSSPSTVWWVPSSSSTTTTTTTQAPSTTTTTTAAPSSTSTTTVPQSSSTTTTTTTAAPSTTASTTPAVSTSQTTTTTTTTAAPASTTVSSTTASATTTSTIKPQVVSGEVKCNEVGYIKHPSDCRKFYQCAQDLDGTFRRHDKECAVNTAFDPETNLCVWPDKVPGCDKNINAI